MRKVTLVEIDRPTPDPDPDSCLNAEISSALDTFIHRVIALGLNPEGVILAVVHGSRDVVKHEIVSQIVTKEQNSTFVKDFFLSIASHTLSMAEEISEQN
jgi:hypothetical protein